MIGITISGLKKYVVACPPMHNMQYLILSAIITNTPLQYSGPYFTGEGDGGGQDTPQPPAPETPVPPLPTTNPDTKPPPITAKPPPSGLYLLISLLGVNAESFLKR